MVNRIYVEKKPSFAVEAAQLLRDAREQLGLSGVTAVRVLNRYDVEGLDAETFASVAPLVFYEPPLDEAYTALPCDELHRVFAWEALPGQFDQRADSAAECIQLITQSARPIVRAARVYVLEGNVSLSDRAALMKYVVNPVDSREASFDLPDSLTEEQPEPAPVETIDGFRQWDAGALDRWIDEQRLSLETADLLCCQDYFRKEGRDPTRTELAILDAYWSDHCRHTTFLTELDSVEINDPAALSTYEGFLRLRKKTGAPTLMELATFGPKALAAQGRPPRVDVSEEINACTVPVTIDEDGELRPWLLLFKNETHNHPTEIEPFGGAATCIGGAIRDPLSGRARVYHAMRVTGAGDPTAPISSTLPGKLPQRKLTQTAAAGFSSYGNQIGLATGYVREFYHKGYTAKRLELGAVIGAVPAENVKRMKPEPGDAVLLIGGRTGRDGIGGASGSSRAHAESSLTSCGAQVQKGNAPTERKLQRLFQNPEAARMIKRCNDFGAGGVCVAIGELADGLDVALDAVPRKYEGLDGTELAVSESQERMAVVVAPEDADAMIEFARRENLEATLVAVVTESPRLVMRWRGQTVADLDRGFLNANGARRHASAVIDERIPSGFCGNAPASRCAPQPAAASLAEEDIPAVNGVPIKQRFESLLSDLNICSQQGLAERFDSTIGAGTVLMPFGGRYQRTPSQAMVARFPVEGETDACSGMACGFQPEWMERDTYGGAYLAVCEAASKLVAAGFERSNLYLTLQEYFPRLGGDPKRWGLPLAALLGALAAQTTLGVAAIGGKDSMSGSFEGLDVPPTLVAFAVGAGSIRRVVSNEFKLTTGGRGASLVCVGVNPLNDPDGFIRTLDGIERLTQSGSLEAAWTLGPGGLAEALFKMGIGNGVGARVTCDPDALFESTPGAMLLALRGDADVGDLPDAFIVGETVAEPAIIIGDERLSLEELSVPYDARLEGVFPRRTVEDKADTSRIAPISFIRQRVTRAGGFAQPRAWIPVFPGTNCEVDTARALERAGAQPVVQVIRNLTPSEIVESASRAAEFIRHSQMIVLPGGFSGGDEPDGSAKLILAFLRNPSVGEALNECLRTGLMLGICNGFQALIKLGLIPFGEIRAQDASSPTLTYNVIGRHQSMLVRTRVASNMSPWLSRCDAGDVYTVPISHGEGRFVISPEQYASLAASGQIVTQYVDMDDSPTMDTPFNPNGSYGAVEGICSPDGRMLGRMGHSERVGRGLYLNVDKNAYQPIFEGGVDYFR
ncbi:MAG: phosphoribosylformylglycinamidine synthase [Oscillospiraceae bacterium]|jgi:phosphoribosylformylglycinamidine synthase|nr:phosphoribosylformylglycinamidine synthase [Oscillospiraceae bacterium]